MNLDEIDWVFIVAVIIGTLASLAREVVNFVGADNLDAIILTMKFIAAVLTVVFAILKFLRLKPFTIDLRASDFHFSDRADLKEGVAFISAKRHKKGKSPSVKTYDVKADGSIAQKKGQPNLLDVFHTLD
ncbi:hypothetical protein [Shewanella khirikhana]|uniref:Uncharacterized protein n=1 Tax=Shewanella khirikhana TaxID=1965282 RepID=A0ABM7DC23_9GAMM|nr:hypothetical protein [Shewanella khirikhana]AZQ11366.1 hypothetical protein STH12_02280 [Shewanella khirikhana]